MRIDFDYIKLKNIGSYGNEVTTINFKEGISLISAINGSGKSFIVEAIVFCLTGKPYRKLKKIKKLINRRNKKNLYTECGFHIDDKYWKITRTLSPDTLEYAFRKPDGTFKTVDSLSSKALDQAEIEKILNIDPFMIKQLVALDVSNNKPFLSLNAAETRAILESVFNLTIFSKMLQEVKSLLGSVESDLKIDNKSLTYLSKDLENQVNNLNSMREMISSFNIIKEQSIAKIQKQIDSIITEKDEILENINDAEEYLKENVVIPVSDIMSTIKFTEDQISELRFNKREQTERLNLLLKGNCPTCKTTFKGDFELELEQTELKQSVTLCDKHIAELLTTIVKLEKQHQEISETNGEIKEIEIALRHEKEHLESLNMRENKLLEEIEFENNKKIEFDIESVKKTCEDTRVQKNALVSRIDTLNKEVANLKDVKKVLSDKGAKAYLMSKYIPLLNNKVQEYLEKFGLNVVVSFNETMEVELIDPKQPGESIEYESFSKGEQKRLDMAILLSFIRVTKEICNWHCNIMFLDELLDSGLDAAGLDSVGNAIKTMVEDDDLCVYIISHKKLSYDLFNNYLFIEKDKYGFSNVSQAIE